MSIALVLDTGGGREMTLAQVAYHLSAGIDEAFVRVSGGSDGVEAALRPLEEDGIVTLVADPESPLPDADWIVRAREGEFFWPRGGSLDEVLSLVPGRFGAVQAAVRQFYGRPDDGRHFAERTIARPAPHAHGSTIETIHRAPAASSALGPGPTLRGWYPVELLRLPVAGGQPVYDGDDAELERAATRGEVVLDTRIRDALRALAGRDSLSGGNMLTAVSAHSGESGLTFPAPDVVMDAALVCELQAAIASEVPACIEDRTRDLDRRARALEGGILASVRRLTARRERSAARPGEATR